MPGSLLIDITEILAMGTYVVSTVLQKKFTAGVFAWLYRFHDEIYLIPGISRTRLVGLACLNNNIRGIGLQPLLIFVTQSAVEIHNPGGHNTLSWICDCCVLSVVVKCILLYYIELVDSINPKIIVRTAPKGLHL
jgi:hypothetical protein